MQDHYRVLGVSPTADREAIRAAYRRLVRESHPDLNQTPVDSAQFANLTAAYRVLSDPLSRKRFDAWRLLLLAPPLRFFLRTLQEPQARRQLADRLSDGLRTIFARPEERLAGEDLTLTRTIEFADSYRGGHLPLVYERRVRCATCHGSGRAHPEACPLCNGAGEIRFPGLAGLKKICPRCGGRGLSGHGRCRDCRGAGWQNEKTTTTLRLPAGITDGTRLRLKEKGHQGARPGSDGQLFVEIRVSGSLHFSRQGDELLAEKVVPLSIALTGGQIALALPDQSVVELDLPAALYPGRQVRFPGRGFPNRDGRPGDLVLTLEVSLPDDLSEKARRTVMHWFDALRHGREEKAARLAEVLTGALE
ncbi:MAG: DnaJ domain-containing protein [Myxococcales bacterium]|nr:DnaJ domain-containing protein [Myxococcales bacterium]